MADMHVTPSSIQGNIFLPSSKSHTLRAIVFATLAQGTSTISNFLPSPDTQAMLAAAKQLGATIMQKSNTLHIEGTGGSLTQPDDVMQCGNSGIVLRFIGAIASLLPQYTILTGDFSIRHLRPIKPLMSALSELGVFAAAARGDDHAPLIIKGPWHSSIAHIDGIDSQPVSSLLIAGAFSSQGLLLHVDNPGERPWIDLTLSWFDRLGIKYARQDYTQYCIPGKQKICSFHYDVPGDLSSAAFPVAAALITRSTLTIHNIDLHDAQGDKKLLSVLQAMGAKFSIHAQEKTVTVYPSDLCGMCVNVGDMIDALPSLAVIGCFAKGVTTITNGAIAKAKESNRITSIATELKKMGAAIDELPDGLLIKTSTLHGTVLHSHHDHRIAMSLCVAALAAQGPSLIEDIECIDKTYPHFAKHFADIHAKIYSSCNQQSLCSIFS